MGWGNAIQAVGVAANLWGSKKGADAAKDAAKGAGAGLDWVKNVYQDAQGNFAPYLGLGQQGVTGLTALLNGDYSGFYNSPDYKAARDAMNYGLDHSAAAKGRLYSGGYMADLSKAQGDLAAGYLGNYRGFLGNVAGMGQNAAAQLGGIGTGTGGLVMQGYNNLANAQGQQAGAQAAMGVNFANGLQSLFGGSTYGGQTQQPQPQPSQYAYTNYGYGPQ